MSPIEILLVEDNPGDVQLTRMILAGCPFSTRLHVVDDGEQALSFLRRHPEHGYAPRPDLILLDLNLPRMNGRELLAAVRMDPQLSSIPVVVLTSAVDEAIADLTGNLCLPKPLDAPGMSTLIDWIRENVAITEPRGSAR